MFFNLGDAKKNQASYMAFGDVDATAYVGDLYSFPLVNDNQWSVKYGGALYRNHTIGGQYLTATAVIDTGVDFMAFPASTYKSFKTQFKIDAAAAGLKVAEYDDLTPSGEMYLNPSKKTAGSVCSDVYKHFGNFTV